MDFRKILVAYMAHVGDAEGTDFLNSFGGSRCLEVLSVRERDALNQAASDADKLRDHQDAAYAKRRQSQPLTP